MSSSIAVTLGITGAGALGTFFRVLITNLDAAFNRQVLGTLAANVAGSFALGLLSASDSNIALIVGVGALGALTTFSTFISQVECISREASIAKAAAYVASSMTLGVVAAVVGIALAS